MTQDTPITEQTVLVQAVEISAADRAINFSTPKLISFDQEISYISVSQGMRIAGVFKRYVRTKAGQLAAVIKDATGVERIVPVSRLLNENSITQHAKSGHSVQFQIRVPPSKNSGEVYRVAILKSIWLPDWADPNDLSQLWVTVEVANFSTNHSNHLNDSLVEDHFDMPTILKLNATT